MSPITINGTGTVAGVSVGGLPDGIVDADMLASDSVTDTKLNVSGEVKAWVNFDGSDTLAVNAQFNVSSVTDHGTGEYTINFNNAMADANYCFIGTLSNANNGTWTDHIAGAIRGPCGVMQRGTMSDSGMQPTTTACRIETRYGSSGSSNGGYQDFGAIYCAFIR